MVEDEGVRSTREAAESQPPNRRDSPRPRPSTVMASNDRVRVRVRLPSLLDPTFLR